MTKHIHRQIVIAFSLILAVCIALTVSFYIFSRNGAQVQHEEAAHSLEATAETARNIVNSEGKFVVRNQTYFSMRKLAYCDSITGAYNRALFLQEMPAKLTAAPKALIVLDIDNAPTIKNLYGLERFNSLLRHIKEALDQQMGPNELFCMGRNERFLLLLDCTTPEQVQQRMSRFFTQIRRFRVSEHQNYQAVCSAGVRFVTHTTPDLERAITEAVMTAETTSGSRQDELLFFDPAICEPVILRNQIEESMDSALMSGEFVMKLQPKIDLVTGRPG